MLPGPTSRLRFREMTDADLDPLAAMLGDPGVMRYYPAPRTREQAAAWITRNRERYDRDGFGLWVVETHEGDFVGDCGLTWQPVDGIARLEVGYHTSPDHQGRGMATEAASACRDLARSVLGAPELIALVHPENTSSRRVAEKVGMTHVEDDRSGPIPLRWVMGMRFDRDERAFGSRADMD